MEDLFFPTADWILDSINENIIPLKGRKASSNQTDGELVRVNRAGV
jgi:hypothetical protein